MKKLSLKVIETKTYFLLLLEELKIPEFEDDEKDIKNPEYLGFIRRFQKYSYYWKRAMVHIDNSKKRLRGTKKRIERDQEEIKV